MVKSIKNIKLSRIFILFILCMVGLSFAILPAPPGVDQRAYPLFGIFISLILGILMQPYPITVLALFGLFAAVSFGIITLEEGLSGFKENVIWLVAFSSIAAKAFVKTNLGRRMASFFIKKTGKNSLSISYGLMLSELVLAPVIPSNTARSACVTLPLTVSISESLGSSPKNKTEKLIGQFLTLCNLHFNQISSAIFLTAIASNPLLQKFMFNIGINISWTEWFIMAGLPGIICMLAVPLVLYKLATPELKKIPNAKAIAQAQLDEMSKMDKNEMITLFVFIGMLTFWVLGIVPTTLVALGGLCVLLATNVLDIDDVSGAKDIWSIVIWLSILNLLAGKLTEFGLIQHYSKVLNTVLHGYSWHFVLLIVSVIYYLARYFIPGNVMHACAMFPAFSQLLITCGVPAKVGCMVLAIITAYCGFVTPYATSPGPITYNTGYIDQKLWWKVGFISSIAYLIIWGFVGGVWWKALGYW